MNVATNATAKQAKPAPALGTKQGAFHCAMCDYETPRKSSFIAHTNTQKHVNAVKLAAISCHPVTPSFSCPSCNKSYKSRSGMWRHTKLCTATVGSEEARTTASSLVDIQHELTEHALTEQSTTTSALNTKTSELTHALITLIKQNQEFQSQIFEIAKESKHITTHNNNTTNNNTQFNLNIFLNEKCKDAINMVDFVNSIHLQLSDLEETGKLGYSGGMSRIFINGLKEMDEHKRPIHCSDLKRETLYIKEDNVWEKDNEDRDKIKKAIRKIEQKNMQQIPLWIKAHPNCLISTNRENTPYLKMVIQSTGGVSTDENTKMDKIITNIAREVFINKVT